MTPDPYFSAMDQLPAERRPSLSRWFLVALLVSSFCTGLVSGYLSVRQLRPYPAWTIGSFLFGVALIYFWYYYDSNERAFARPRGLGTAVILLAVVAVPYYLAVSRPKGRRLSAVLRYFGFACIYLLLAVAGAVVEVMIFNLLR